MKRIVYLGLIIAAIVVMILSSSNIFSQLNQHHIDMQISNDEAVTYRLKEHIVEKFYKAQLDTVFLASFLGDHLKGSDADSSNKIEEVKTELNSVVPSLLKVNSIFSNMSYIDMNGMELITMDVNGSVGGPFLGTLIKDECFKKTFQHKTGEVYTTFDSNAIYICSPVFDSTAILSGIIVMVVDKGEMFKEILPLLSKGDVILMEDTGEYILSSAGHYGKKNFLDEYSDSLFHKILKLQSGNLVSDKKTLITYMPVDLDDRQWFLLLSTDKESVVDQFYTLYEQLVIVLALAVLAIIAAVVFWLSSKKKEQISEQDKIQKEILQAIIDSFGAGIIMMDVSGKIIFINKAWKEIFSYLDFDKYGSSCENFYIDDDICDNSKVLIQNMMTGIENNCEIISKLTGLIGDGESSYVVDLEQSSPIKRFINLYSNPCISHTNHNYGRVFVVRDVSHQKEVDRLKLELVSTVSHELRTPMSSILGFTELLLTRKLAEERSKEYISIINSEARRLTDLINDFLDIQRMESGKLIFHKKFNPIGEIIEEAIKLFENHNDKHIIIYGKSTENIGPVKCDREKILQVFSNLLSNAIKYSPDGGEIKVDLVVHAGKIRVSISDHGLGIPDDVIDKLFTKFFRVNNDDRRKIGGTGLGLAICKEIIRAHGGEISVESTYGYGSTFYFYLPYSDINTSGERRT